MALETGDGFISGLVAANPPGGDVTGQGDDHIRLVKTALAGTFPNASRAFRFATAAAAKTTVYTILATDENALIRADVSGGAFTITMPLGSAVFAGYRVVVMKSDSSANAVTVDGSGAETINGSTTRTLGSQYQAEAYMWEGTEWKLLNNSTVKLSAQLDVNGFALGDGTLELLDFVEAASAVNNLRITNAATGGNPKLSVVGDDTNVNMEIVTKGTGDVIFLADAIELLKVVQVASAVNFPQLQPSATGNAVTLAAFGGDANIGIDLSPKGTGTVSVGGAPIGLVLSAKQSASGTEIDFTSIASTTKRITIMLDQVSLSGTDEIEVQLGDSGGFETTGYAGGVNREGIVAVAFSSGFQVNTGAAASELWSGSLTITLFDAATNAWVGTSLMGENSGANCAHAGGRKALSGTLTQIRVKPTGANTFDSGDINIVVE